MFFVPTGENSDDSPYLLLIPTFTEKWPETTLINSDRPLCLIDNIIFSY